MPTDETTPTPLPTPEAPVPEAGGPKPKSKVGRKKSKVKLTQAALEHEIERRREAVAELTAQGATIREIVDLLKNRGIINPETLEPWSRDTVNVDQLWAKEQWRKNAAKSTAEHIERLLGEIQAAKRRCWMEGDLTNLKGFIERESKILGADAAINLKQDIAASVENTLTIPSLEGMSGSDLSDLAKAMTGFLQELEAGGK